MPLTRVQPGLLEATGTASSSTFLRGDGAWSTTITSGTAVSASGTSVDFTGIASTAKRITVMFDGVSTNGSSNPQIQIGAGSVATSGYASTCSWLGGTGFTTTGNWATSGFLVVVGGGATNLYGGIATLTTLGNNIWVYSSNLTYGNGSTFCLVGAGNTTLGGTLDRVRITTTNGTDTFDAGTINILVE
jgi:hypothetical protein